MQMTLSSHKLALDQTFPGQSAAAAAGCAGEAVPWMSEAEGSGCCAPPRAAHPSKKAVFHQTQ